MIMIRPIRLFLIFFSFLYTTNCLAQHQKIANELIVWSSSMTESPDASYELEVLSASMQLYLLRFNDAKLAGRMKKSLQLKDHVAYVGYNYFIEYRDTIPNDVEFSPHWNYDPNPRNDVNAYSAWDLARGGITLDGDTIVMAVIDDGVDISHPDLDSNIWFNADEIPNNNIDDDGNGYIDDVNGWNVESDNGNIIVGPHGTKVAGIMGAVGNNRIGVTGANWDTKLMPICMGDSGTVAKVIKAYEYILLQRRRYNDSNGSEGAFIVVSNNSFGLKGFQYASAPFWCDFFDTLGQEGILTVSAAPNEQFNIDEIGDLPTVCPSPYLITAASINLEGEWMNAAYSNTHVDLAAPGERVSTTFPDGDYGIIEGTSASSAIVSGLVGLLYSVNCDALIEVVKLDPSLANQQIKDLILSAGDQRPFLSSKTVSGGFVDYYETLLRASQPCDTCEAPDLIKIDRSGDSVIISILPQFDSLKWLVRTQGGLEWDTLTPLPNDTLILEEGIGCQNLELSFIPVCNETAGQRSRIFNLSAFSNCDYCDQAYCMPNVPGSTDYWIDEIAYTPRDAEAYTGNDLGYGSYSGTVFTTYETTKANWVDIIMGIQDTALNYRAQIWIDLDHDGTFEQDEIVGRSVTPFDRFQKVDLDIPFTSLPGITRMRIAVVPVEANEQIVVCKQGNSAIIYEDHCVELVVENPSCVLIDSLNVLEKEATTLDLAIIPQLDDSEAINVRYRKQGETDWDYKTFDNTRFTLIDLAGPCTPYEIEVRRVCGFDTSAYSETQIVETNCPNSVSSGADSDLTIYPNPFRQQVFLSDERLVGRSSQIQLINAQGKLVSTLRHDQLQLGTDLLRGLGETLPDGMYWLKIISGQKVYSTKLFKAAVHR